MTKTTRVGCERRDRVEIATHSYPFVKMTLFSLPSHFSLLHTWRDGKKAASDMWKAIFAGEIRQGTPRVIFPFCATRFSPTWLDCLRKRCRVFFYRPYMENFLEKWTFFQYHTYMRTRMPSDIFIYTIFAAEAERDGRRGEIFSMEHQYEVQWRPHHLRDADLVIFIHSWSLNCFLVLGG